MVLVFFIVISVIIIGLAIINFFLAIHPPKMGSNRDPSSLNIEYESVSFQTADGLTLKGWFIPHKDKKSDAVIIVGHGYPFSKSDVLSFAPFLHKHYNLLFFDFRYFGESEGRYTTVGWKEQEDVLAALSYLKTRTDINKEKIGAIGFSLSASTF